MWYNASNQHYTTFCCAVGVSAGAILSDNQQAFGQYQF